MTAPPPPRKHPKLQFWLLYAGFLVLCALLLIGVAELAVRWLVPEPYWRFRDAKSDWQPDAEIGWVNRAGLDVSDRRDGEGVVRFRLNADGLQPAEAVESRTPGRPRVMIFGDSATVGRAVPEDGRLVPQLTRALQRTGIDCEVLCAGVQAHATDQALLMMRRLLPRYRPDVVIHMVCDNDFAGNATGVDYGLAKPRFELNAGELRETTPSPAEVERLWNAGDKGLRNYLQHMALYRFMLPSLLQLRSNSDWRQAALSSSGRAGRSVAYLKKVNWELFSGLVQAMQKECSKYDAEFVLTEHPHIWEVWDSDATPEQRLWLNRKLLAVAEARQIRYCEVVPHFLSVRDEGPFHLLPRDPHCNAKGYEITARILAEYLQANGLPAKPVTTPSQNPKSPW